MFIFTIYQALCQATPRCRAQFSHKPTRDFFISTEVFWIKRNESANSIRFYLHAIHFAILALYRFDHMIGCPIVCVYQRFIQVFFGWRIAAVPACGWLWSGLSQVEIKRSWVSLLSCVGLIASRVFAFLMDCIIRCIKIHNNWLSRISISH